MISPKDHRIIQIDITNACIHTCSNCTRFCGHHVKPYFMEYETFCTAVDSIIDHPGMIGIIGGEPTLHPQFAKMCEYLQSKISSEKKINAEILRYPTDELIETRRRIELGEYEIEKYNNSPSFVVKGVGLWTSLTQTYLKHYELIQNTFNWQNINDHSSASYHQPILITRKELQINDKQWNKLREKCWVNHDWSGSITPKGCFFCEVAASLDMLYDGPGGLPIEKDWWKRDISDYKNQFKWCEICGIPLKTFSRDARESIDDISPYHFNKLNKVGKIYTKKKELNILNISDGKISENSIKSTAKYHGQTYIKDAKLRVSKETAIYARLFYGVLIDNESDSINSIYNAINNNISFFEKLVLLTCRKIPKTFLKDKIDIIMYQKDNAFDNLMQSVEYFGQGKYVIFFTPEIIFDSGLEILKKCIINPGTLHYINFESNIKKIENDYIFNSNYLKTGICMLINSYALSLNNINKIEDDIIHCIKAIVSQWKKNMVIEFSNDMNRNIYINKRIIKKNRMGDVIKILNKFNKKYGIIKTVLSLLFFIKHYGIRLAVNKVKNRVI